MKEVTEMNYCLNLKNSRGYTLLEVLLAVTILGIMFMTIMGFFSQSFQYTQKNESKTVGVNFARSVLNYIEGQDYEKMKDVVSEGITDLNISSCDSLENNGKPVLEGNCKSMFNTIINNVDYKATAEIGIHKENDLKEYLIPITVHVEWNDEVAEVKGVIKSD